MYTYRFEFLLEVIMRIASLLATHLAWAALYALCLTACGQAPGGPPPATTGTPKVSAITLESEPFILVAELPGRVTPMIGAQVRPQVTGIIEKRLFVEGDRVAPGQLLYQLDPATYKASVDSAEADLARAKASLNLAQLKAKRNRELMAIKAISQQDADESNAGLKQAQADVAAAKAELQTHQINLQYTKIRSPVAGRIGRSAVTAGALVTANQATALATVQQLDPIYIDVTQSSLALLELKRSLSAGALSPSTAPVVIMLQNGARHVKNGTLEFSEARVDETTDTVTLRIKVPNPNGDLLPGMYARALLEAGVVEDAILVPQQALARDAEGQGYVALVDATGVMVQRKVTVSRAVGNQWLIEDGLSPGEQIIVEGQQKVQPGSKVEVVAPVEASDDNRIVQL